MATTKSHRKNVRSSVNGHMDELKSQAISIGDAVRSMAATAGEAAGDSLTPIEKYVQDKPIKSILIAAGAGALLGMFMFRR